MKDVLTSLMSGQSFATMMVKKLRCYSISGSAEPVIMQQIIPRDKCAKDLSVFFPLVLSRGINT